uniref:Cep57 centrosome localisation domain-containing protein n=1 Tax=Ficedula albicollis TaxID=59894 RepID=A0A803WBD9_FICAL
MVSSAELEKKMILKQQAQLQKEEGQNRLELHAKLEKLEMLEKECLKLTATQRIAEDKIKHLEEKLCKEEHQHKLIQDKKAQISYSSVLESLLGVLHISMKKYSTCVCISETIYQPQHRSN